MGYALERWLYRLSLSPHADQFVLKGALMLVVWRIPTTRPTRDIDLLARTSNNLDAVRELVAEICGTLVPDDGLSFDAEKVTTTRIAEDAYLPYPARTPAQDARRITPWRSLAQRLGVSPARSGVGRFARRSRRHVINVGVTAAR